MTFFHIDNCYLFCYKEFISYRIYKSLRSKILQKSKTLPIPILNFFIFLIMSYNTGSGIREIQTMMKATFNIVHMKTEVRHR